jgi:hypothetical protein
MYLKGLLLVVSFFYLQLGFAQEDDYVVKDKKSAKPLYKKDLYSTPNPDYTSYFISPTAFTITKRDFRLASNDLIFFKVTYGLTSNTNVSINTSLFGSIIGSVKHSIVLKENQQLSFSASFGDFTASLKDTNVLFGGCDANFTLGDHQNNVTFGTGFHVVKSNIDLIQDKRQFFVHTLNFGVQRQIAKKTYLMIDGYYFTNYSILTGAAGFKFVIKTRYTLNAGVMPILWNNIRNTRYDVKPILIPVVSFRMLIERKD